MTHDHDHGDIAVQVRRTQLDFLEGSISRRVFVRRMTALGAAVAATSMLAPLLPPVQEASAADAGSPVRGGTLHYGQDPPGNAAGLPFRAPLPSGGHRVPRYPAPAA